MHACMHAYIHTYNQFDYMYNVYIYIYIQYIIDLRGNRMNLKNRQMATTSAVLDGSARSQRLVISSDTVEASQILRG